MTTITGIPFVPQGTLDPAAGLNLAINTLLPLVQTAVLDMNRTAPPVSSADGDLHIVNTPATGVWLGQENNLARYVADGDFWQFYIPDDQVRLILNFDDNGFYKFVPDSSGGSWVLAAGLGDAPADGEPYVRRDAAWEVMPTLTVSDGSTAPVETEVIELSFLGMVSVVATTNGGVEVTIPESVPADATLLTVGDETADLPNSRRLLAGSGIAFNDATPGQRTITSTGGPPLPNKYWIAGAGALEPLGANAATAVGTATTPAKVTGGNITGYMTKRRQTSTTAANNVASLRASNAADEAYSAVTGSASASGLYLNMRFGTPIVVAGERFFAGLAPNAAEAGTVDPSALINCFGVGKDGADTNYQIIHNDGTGAGTKIDTGLAFAANKSFDLALSVPSGGASWSYVLTDLDTGVLYSGTVAANIPAADTPLLWRIWGSVGASAGTAIAVDGSYIGLRYPL